MLTMETQKKRIYRYLLIIPMIAVLWGINELVQGQEKSGVPTIEMPPAPPVAPEPAKAPVPPAPPESPAISEEEYKDADKMPEFPGGNAAMARFIADNITYPEEAQEKKIEGVVVLELTIDEKGKIIKIHALKKVEYGCTEAAKDVVEKMPRWTPGEQDGKPVKVKVVLPVRFQLTD